MTNEVVAGPRRPFADEKARGENTHTHTYIGDPKRSVFNIGEMGLDDQNRDQN